MSINKKLSRKKQSDENDDFLDIRGLSEQEVKDRYEQGLVNRADNQTSRSLFSIMRSNIITPFNGLLMVMGLAMLWPILANGVSWVNLSFLGVMIVNIIIGIAQEVKAKLVLDRLAIMVKPHVQVIRDSKIQIIASSEVVKDDYIILSLGDQVVVDGKVVKSSGIEIDESLLTGESDPIAKSVDDEVMSGSLVIAGGGVVQATRVGNDSYSAKLANEAKKFKRVSSELIDATNTIMRWIGLLMIIVAPILIIGQFRIKGDFSTALVHVVSAIIGMIPEGLVLLTSTAFMLATIKLARDNVLVQRLPAVETLSRVDKLLLDKTGTLTSGVMRFERITELNDFDNYKISQVLATIGSRASSPTNRALTKQFSGAADFTREVPFSSARKWSAIEVEGVAYIFGAPEIILNNCTHKEYLSQAGHLADGGLRVLVLCKIDKWIEDKSNLDKANIHPLALVMFAEEVRPDTAKILGFFNDQGVDVKIISGDSPRTVGAVASKVGLEASIFDARNLPDYNKDPELFLDIVNKNNVFGRVLPEQKRQIAAVLQNAGSVVAMTGDGVNDALALKKADLGIAMESGSSATKAVAEVILMDDKFAHLPLVLAEGRRVVANIERVANLFIIKNVYVALLALSATAIGLAYPLVPIQMTLISALSIGVPAFFLALAPNGRRYRPGFLSRVLRFAIPTGFIIAVAMIVGYYLIDRKGISTDLAGTSVSVIAMSIMTGVLVHLSNPLKLWKVALILVCDIAFIICLSLPKLSRIFSMSLDYSTLPIAFTVAAMAMITISLSTRWLLGFNRKNSLN